MKLFGRHVHFRQMTWRDFLISCASLLGIPALLLFVAGFLLEGRCELALFFFSLIPCAILAIIMGGSATAIRRYRDPNAPPGALVDSQVFFLTFALLIVVVTALLYPLDDGSNLLGACANHKLPEIQLIQ